MGDWKIIVNGSAKDFYDDYGFKVTQMPGAGMPPVNNIVTDYGLSDGAYFQRTLAAPRQFSLVGYMSGSAMTDLYSKRKALINVINRDRTTDTEPVEIQFTGGATTLQASAYYVAGLELGPITNTTELEMALTFDMIDPFWQKPTLTTGSLLTVDESPLGPVIEITKDGRFLPLSIDASATSIDGGNTYCMAVGVNSNVYIGYYTSHHAVAAWDASASLWSACLGDVTFNSPIYTLFLTSDNILYAGGAFTTVGGSSFSRMAKYTGSTWEAVSSSAPDSAVYAFQLDRNNDLWVGGYFTQIGSASYAKVARLLSGSSDTWISCSGVSGSILATDSFSNINGFHLAKDGNMFAYGARMGASPRSGSLNYVGHYNTSTCAWSNYGACHLNGSVEALLEASDGQIYISGAFDYIGEGDLVDCSLGIAVKENGVLTPLLPDLPSQSDATNKDTLFQRSNGLIYYRGTHPDGDNIHDNNIAISSIRYTGDYAVYPEYENFQVMAMNPATESFYAPYTSASTTSPNNVMGGTIITNSGTAKTYPIITTCGPGKFVLLSNGTSQQTIFINTVYVASGEEIVFDFRPGKKTVTSNFYGNILDRIVPGSELSDFKLLPGDNLVNLFCYDFRTGVTPNAKIEYYERYWSIDS